MSKRRTAALSLAAVIVAAVAACSMDSSVAPGSAGGAPSVAAGAAGPSTLQGPAGIHALQRARALGGDRSWSFLVGPEGGGMHDPVTGLTIIFPRGAVDGRMKITVTALAGASVAYRFEPHGLQFAAPVTFSQSLRGTHTWSGDSAVAPLTGAYFVDERLQIDPATGEALVSELRPATLDSHDVLSFQIHHFSGYTVASAVRDSSQNGGVQ